MLRTRKHGDFPTLDRNHGMPWIVRCKVTTRAVDPAGWPMVQEFRCVFSRQSTDGGELLTMLITPDNRDRELIQEQKRHRLTIR
jgi:hypothetical protein